MMTVNGLATRAGVPGHVVRYYTRAGLLRPRRDPKNGYRQYRDADVIRLRFIRRAKLLGFTLGDIRQVLRDADRRHSPCPKARQIIIDRLEESGRNLTILLALQKRMRDAVQLWRTLPDAIPDGASICHLIEAATEDEILD